MKTFYARKKPIPVKFIEPLSMDASEIKELDITIKDGKWYMATFENKAYEFCPSIHLIAEGVNGERYIVERGIFEKTYDTILDDNSIETNLKYEISDDIISLLGLIRVLNYHRQTIYGNNKLAESQASEVRQKGKSEHEESESLRASFIEKCMPNKEILIQWIKENENLIRKQNSIIGESLLNQLEENNLI